MSPESAPEIANAIHQLRQESRSRMGAFVAKRRGAEVYTVGVYMGRGVATENDRKPTSPPQDRTSISARTPRWR